MTVLAAAHWEDDDIIFYGMASDMFMGDGSLIIPREEPKQVKVNNVMISYCGHITTARHALKNLGFETGHADSDFNPALTLHLSTAQDFAHHIADTTELDDETSFLIVGPDGIWCSQKNETNPIPAVQHRYAYYAEGAGGQIALGALAGMTKHKPYPNKDDVMNIVPAIEIACKYSVYCLEPITVNFIEIEKTEKQDD